MPHLDQQETKDVVESVDRMLTHIRAAVQQGQNLGMAGVRFPGASMGKVLGFLQDASGELHRYRDQAEKREPVLSGGITT